MRERVRGPDAPRLVLLEAWEQCKDAEVLIESPPAMAGVHIAEALSEWPCAECCQRHSRFCRHPLFPRVHNAVVEDGAVPAPVH